MYVREAKGQTLTLSVSGKLWADSLVMLDKETQSNWSHLLGEAMSGPLTGTVLESLPSLMTDWKTWKTGHPATTVVMLDRTSGYFRRNMYQDPSEFLIGLTLDKQSRAWGFDRLRKHPVVNDRLSKTHLLVLFDPASSTAILFDRKIDKKVLTFEERDGKLIDRETESVWNSIRGNCVEGTYTGKQLTPIAGIVSFTRAWMTFHPASTTWEPSENDADED